MPARRSLARASTRQESGGGLKSGDCGADNCARRRPPGRFRRSGASAPARRPRTIRATAGRPSSPARPGSATASARGWWPTPGVRRLGGPPARALRHAGRRPGPWPTASAPTWSPSTSTAGSLPGIWTSSTGSGACGRPQRRPVAPADEAAQLAPAQLPVLAQRPFQPRRTPRIEEAACARQAAPASSRHSARVPRRAERCRLGRAGAYHAATPVAARPRSTGARRSPGKLFIATLPAWPPPATRAAGPPSSTSRPRRACRSRPPRARSGDSPLVTDTPAGGSSTRPSGSASSPTGSPARSGRGATMAVGLVVPDVGRAF